METTLTVHSRWPCRMCREHTSMVKLAGGFTRIYLKDMSKLASWPDFAEACTERMTQRQFGEDARSDVLKESSMKVGTACPAFFCSCDGDLKGLCHGDDFCVVARQKQLQTFGKFIEKRFEVKQTGHIGFGANDKKELKILNRTIKIDVLHDEMTLEADTKLVGNALESMKLNGAKGVDSPRVRRNEEQTGQIENSEKLTSAESTLYRSLVMKLAYVAQDRVDIAEAVKCLTRHIKEPRSGHVQELKRLGRYLVKNRRCVLTYAR